MVNYSILQVGAALDHGGVERGIVEMNAWLVAHGQTSHVASAGGKLVADIEAAGGKHHTLPLAGKNPMTIVLNGWRLAQLVKREKIQIIHARSRAPAWSCWIASKLSGVPYVTTFHAIHGAKSGLKRLYNSSMLRGQALMANSEFTKQHLIDVYGVAPDDITVAARGVDTEEFDPAKISLAQLTSVRRELDLTELKPVILLPMRHSITKGQDLVFEALSGLPELDYQLVVLGDGPMRQRYEEMTHELGIASKTKFIGNRKDIALLFKLADLSIVPSRKPEAFGRTIAESLAMGTPVIAAAHGGALEIVINGETGLLFQSENVGELAEKIKQALDNTAWRKNASALAQKDIPQRFSVEKMCSTEFDVLQKVLEQTA